MIIFLLVLIFLAILWPGVIRFTLTLMLALWLLSPLWTPAHAAPERCIVALNKDFSVVKKGYQFRATSHDHGTVFGHGDGSFPEDVISWITPCTEVYAPGTPANEGGVLR